MLPIELFDFVSKKYLINYQLSQLDPAAAAICGPIAPKPQAAPHAIIMDGEDPLDPPKKGYFYGKRKRSRGLSRYPSRGNKKPRTSRPASDTAAAPPSPLQEPDRDGREHHEIANRPRTKF